MSKVLNPVLPSASLLERKGLSLVWRPVEAGDNADVIALIGGIFHDYGFELDLPDEDRDLLDIQGLYGQPGCGLSVLRDQSTGTLVGTCGFLRRQGKGPSENGDPIAELMRFYIHPQYRGHGLGQWMLEAVMDQCRGLGYGIMVLESHTRLDHALALYRRNGFQTTSREAFPCETLPCCNVFMVRDL